MEGEGGGRKVMAPLKRGFKNKCRSKGSHASLLEMAPTKCKAVLLEVKKQILEEFHCGFKVNALV